MALSTAAGWNQLAADWSLFIEHGAVWGLRCEHRLVASAALLPFGPGRAWLSMVLTLPEFRRRGFASRLVAHALGEGTGRARRVLLDATPLGQPLYERLGFRPLWSFRRWRVPRRAPLPRRASAVVRRIRAEDRASILALDHAVFGAPRGFVLEDLARRCPAAAAVAVAGERLVGFVLARPGRIAPQVGPLVAEDETIALALLATALDGLDGAEAVVVDVPDHQHAFLEHLGQAGGEPLRAFLRMSDGAEPPEPAAPALFALAGPEFG